MKKIIFIIFIILLSTSAFSLGNHKIMVYQSGNVTINTSLITGTKLSCNDVVDASYNVCTGGGAGSNYTNSSPISLIGSTFGLSECPTGEIYKFNTTGTSEWECSEDQSGVGVRWDLNTTTIVNQTNKITINRTTEDSFYYRKTEVSNLFVNRTDWTTHDNYPAACTAGEYVTQIGDTLTCSIPPGTMDKWDINTTSIVNQTGQLTINRTTEDSFYYRKSEVSNLFVNRTDWTTHDNYPAACTGIQLVQGLGDTLTCVNPVGNSTETIQDVTGGMVSGNSEVNIDVTYDDTNGKLDFKVDQLWVNSTGGTFTGEIQVKNITFEEDTTNHKIWDNTTCVIIRGDTSQLEIC